MLRGRAAALIDSRHWETADDLARAYEAWGAFAYGEGQDGAPARDAFRARFGAGGGAQEPGQPEHDLFDSDDYFQYHGGMIAAVRAIRGPRPPRTSGTAPTPAPGGAQPARGSPARLPHPRRQPPLARGDARHGYKGAMELAATVDYLFGYDATAGVASDWMYETLARRYALDPQQVAAFRRQSLGPARRHRPAPRSRLPWHVGPAASGDPGRPAPAVPQRRGRPRSVAHPAPWPAPDERRPPRSALLSATTPVFPFSAIAGQETLKQVLLLNAVQPSIGGP